MGLGKLLFFGILLASVYIPLSIHIPEGIEDRQRLYPIAVVLRLLSYISGTLSRLGVNDVFAATRLITSLNPLLASSPKDVTVNEAYFDGIRVKIFRPAQLPASSVPAFIYIHGGGLVVGSPEEYSYVTGYLAKEVGMVVVSVSYRLAPKHLYPAQSDDVLTATEYFLTHCSEWGVDPNKIFMGGDSAGGFLTAVTTIRLIKKNLPKPRAIVLIYPVLQLISYATPSYIQNADDFLQSRTKSIIMRLSYLVGKSQESLEAFKVNNFTSVATRKEIADRFNLPELANRGPRHFDQDGDPELIRQFQNLTDELNSPLLTSVIDQFPPTLLIACEFDILRDDSVMMARRLRNSNVRVEYRVHYGMHGMISFAPSYNPGSVALRQIVEFVNQWKQ